MCEPISSFTGTSSTTFMQRHRRNIRLLSSHASGRSDNNNNKHSLVNGFGFLVNRRHGEICVCRYSRIRYKIYGSNELVNMKLV